MIDPLCPMWFEEPPAAAPAAEPREETVTAALANAVADACALLLRLRGQVPYRSSGWWLLNNAACHVSDGFWRQAGPSQSEESALERDRRTR